MVPDLPATTSRSRLGRAVDRCASPLVALLFGCLSLALIGLAGQPEPVADSPQVLAGETVRVAPGESIQSAMNAAGPGATIVIGAGIHQGQSVTPLDDMVVRGEAGAVLDGSGASLPYAIYGAAANVTIANLEIRNYTKPIWGPNDYRHQGAIHGANMNAGGGFIAIASNWTVENNNVHSNAGWGVSPGDDFHVVGNALHHNGMAGIGGGDFNGGLFERNDIFDNNDPSNSFGDFNYDTGRPWDWAWNAAGIKVAAVNCRTLASTGACSGGTPLIIRDNTVHDNHGVGIWCDINCNEVVIESNLVERNIGTDSVGIFYEISQNGTIRNNVVRNQGSQGDYLSPSGILVWSSDTVLVEGNRVENTKNAIVGNARPREFSRTLRNLTVRNNEIITAGVSTRLGIATDTSTDFKTAGNTFTDNWFDQPASMSFWWTDVSRGESSLTLAQWQALGFTSATASPGSPPVPQGTGPAATPTAPAGSAPVAASAPAATEPIGDAPAAAPEAAGTDSPPSSQASGALPPASISPSTLRPQTPATGTNAASDNPVSEDPVAENAVAENAVAENAVSADGAATTDMPISGEPRPSSTDANEAPEALAFAPEQTSDRSDPEISLDTRSADTAVVTLDSTGGGMGTNLLSAFGVLSVGLAIWLTGRRLANLR